MISVIIPRVQVGLVTYSYQVIKTPQDLLLVKPYIIKRLEDIENVMPTHGVGEKYAYIDVATCKVVHARAINDAIAGVFPLDLYLGFLRRIYIVSGLAQSDKEVGEEVKQLYDLAMYIKINEEEE